MQLSAQSSIWHNI